MIKGIYEINVGKGADDRINIYGQNRRRRQASGVLGELVTKMENVNRKEKGEKESRSLLDRGDVRKFVNIYEEKIKLK